LGSDRHLPPDRIPEVRRRAERPLDPRRRDVDRVAVEIAPKQVGDALAERMVHPGRMVDIDGEPFRAGELDGEHLDPRKPLVHGAAAGTRDFFLYEHLHRVLPPARIGVATFDRRGDGASTGDASRGRFEVQAEDALAVADALGAKHVGLWGISQGGWVAPLAAATSDRVEFLVLIASTGVTPSEQMMYAVAEQLRLAGHGEDLVERVLDLRRRFEDSVHGRPVDEARLTDD